MHALGLLARPWRRLIAPVLYGAVLVAASGCASPQPAQRETPLVLQPSPVPMPTPVVELQPLQPEPAISSSAPAPATAAPAEQPITRGPDYIALLLPTKAKQWRVAAETIQSGVLAAERTLADARTPRVRLIATEDNEQDILAAFDRASQDGAVAVIGPLSKTAIGLIGDGADIQMPVVALNAFAEETLRRRNLYSFSLAIEGEAQQAARLVADRGVQRPAVIVADGSLTQRMAQGFSSAWRAERNALPAVLPISAASNFNDLRARIDATGADGVFLATDSRTARRLRPFIGNDLPVFATSQIDPGNLGATALVDLAGISFYDIPWLATPDDPTYDFYARKRTRTNDLERLFAQGVDAYRLVQALRSSEPGNVRIPDGLTGKLTIDGNGVVQRGLSVRTLKANPAELPPEPVVEPLPVVQ
ncbi:penicillin-binding protein activator [Chitinolyticbacter meiyuanensis]|uniref:penicillin-binding protein activator n=1 Tax=Chitinolyticbacter meiyuanensis TaxID=682798 RepID=UPI0011E5B1DA|nr:penicillin-binding protein activator [Chitinolyticbacter meiyuanensis]